MTRKKWSIFTYCIPLIALLIVASQFILVKTSYLNKWKGGGFGMYSEVHYYYNDLVINKLIKPIDSLIAEDRSLAAFVKNVKRRPNSANLQLIGELVSKYAISDTITVQVWKPLIDSNNSSYSRELVNQYQFVK